MVANCQRLRTAVTDLIDVQAVPGYSTPIRSIGVFVDCNTRHDESHTDKHVYNDQRWDQKIVAVVDRWSLFGGR